LGGQVEVLGQAQDVEITMGHGIMFADQAAFFKPDWGAATPAGDRSLRWAAP
jgi:hypothetical protein